MRPNQSRRGGRPRASQSQVSRHGSVGNGRPARHSGPHHQRGTAPFAGNSRQRRSSESADSSSGSSGSESSTDSDSDTDWSDSQDLRRGASQSADGQASSTNVRVIVRIRPLVGHELANGAYSCIHGITPKDMQVALPHEDADDRLIANRSFAFDHVFAPDTPQVDVFEQSGIQILCNSSLAGYASTVFAYGQTGSGKTYTMSGLEERIVATGSFASPDTDGLIPRSLRYVFEECDKRKHEAEFKIRASYLEIYNEQVIDLLNFDKRGDKVKPLHIRQRPSVGFFVEQLMLVDCSTVKDVLVLAGQGHKNRHVSAHALNRDSSRSHSMMTVYVEQIITDQDHGGSYKKHGKITFVDLAGSENLKQSKSAGVHAKETANINKSLFSLGKVISALGDIHTGKKPRNYHIPYRDSTLTKLLMDSLGGSGLTMMIGCCSPANNYAEETLRTLHYATRARNIQNQPLVHMDPREQLILHLKTDLHRLREYATTITTLAEESGAVLPPMPELSSNPNRMKNSFQAAAAAMRMKALGKMGKHPDGIAALARRSVADAETFSSLTSRLKRDKVSFSDSDSDSDDAGDGLQRLNVRASGSIFDFHRVLKEEEEAHGQAAKTRLGLSHDLKGSGSMKTMLAAANAMSRGSGDKTPEPGGPVVPAAAFAHLMTQNQTLRRKLQHLERVFVSKTDSSLWKGSPATPSAGSLSNGLASPSFAQPPIRGHTSDGRVGFYGTNASSSQSLTQDSTAFNPFKNDNEKLKAQNRTMRERNGELLKTVQVLQTYILDSGGKLPAGAAIDMSAIAAGVSASPNQQGTLNSIDERFYIPRSIGGRASTSGLDRSATQSRPLQPMIQRALSMIGPGVSQYHRSGSSESDHMTAPIVAGLSEARNTGVRESPKIGDHTAGSEKMEEWRQRQSQADGRVRRALQSRGLWDNYDERRGLAAVPQYPEPLVLPSAQAAAARAAVDRPRSGSFQRNHELPPLNPPAEMPISGNQPIHTSPVYTESANRLSLKSVGTPSPPTSLRNLAGSARPNRVAGSASSGRRENADQSYQPMTQASPRVTTDFEAVSHDTQSVHERFDDGASLFSRKGRARGR